MPSVKRAVLIAGATASGKSALALEVARARNGVIINADAMQVYRELRILTARPSLEEEASVPHRLYGHVPAGRDYSAAQWLEDARAAIAAAWDEGRVPIVAGGTGLYFRVLAHGIAAVPPIAPDIRRKWRDFAGSLHAELAQRDPAGAAALKPNDRQRLARALEVVEATGRPLAYLQQQRGGGSVLDEAAVEHRFVEVPRAELHRRAEARFDAMMAQGALAEVRPLLGLDPRLPAMRAIGVRELAAHLRGELPLDAAVAAAKTATRRYIKRQLTWWRGQGRTIWPAAALPGRLPVIASEP